jgi:hypothetical protein
MSSSFGLYGNFVRKDEITFRLQMRTNPSNKAFGLERHQLLQGMTK